MISKKNLKLTGTICRYLLIIVVSIFGFSIFGRLFANILIYILAWLLNFFYEEVIRRGLYVYVDGQSFEITYTCAMSVFYWILFVLVFATADLNAIKRIYALGFAWLSVFTFNILRILFLIAIVHTPYFNAFHWIFENVISIILLVVVWMATTRVLDIKTLPFYSDLKSFKKGFTKIARR